MNLSLSPFLAFFKTFTESKPYSQPLTKVRWPWWITAAVVRKLKQCTTVKRHVNTERFGVSRRTQTVFTLEMVGQKMHKCWHWPSYPQPLPDNWENAPTLGRYRSRWEFISSWQFGWTFSKFRQLSASVHSIRQTLPPHSSPHLLSRLLLFFATPI